MPDPLRTRAAARWAALFFIVAGLLALVGSFFLEAGQPQYTSFLVLGLVDIAIGLVLRALPWQRWPPHTLAAILPLAFVMIGLFEIVGTNTYYTYPIFFVLVFIWIGLALPPRSSLLIAPLTIIAYILPLLAPGYPAQAAQSAAVVVPVCVLIGEVIAHVMKQLRVARADLEQRVVERTAQLAAANDALHAELARRHDAEATLRESEERFRQMVSHIEEVFWLSDPHQDRIIYISPAYETIWGRSCASLYERSRSFLDAVHPDDTERLLAALQRQRQGEATAEEYRIIRPDGSLRWIWDRGNPVFDAYGKLDRVAGIAQDVTERKQLEAQLLLAQKLEGIGRLAGGIAHDFNNLLTVIGGYAQLVIDFLSPDHILQSDLEEIQKGVERANGLTRQLLAFARKQILEPRVLDLNDLVLELDKMLRRIIGADIELLTNPAHEPGWVKADPSQVEQVLVNLAVNARDAMPEGGQFTIELANVVIESGYVQNELEPGPYVRLTVSDTGIGMAPEIQAHVFEPFFSTKAPGKGSGLGLATCYGIIQRHGGSIQLDSQLGRGTTFTIYLPQVAAEDSTAAPPQADIAAPMGNETVLVVEDEDAVRNLAVRVLRSYGYTVLEADNGRAAFQLAAAYAPAPIHLLLTDVVMPHLGGVAVADRLSARFPTLKVLFVSGYTDNLIAKDGELEEGTALLHKPFTPTILARKVREVLDG